MEYLKILLALLVTMQCTTQVVADMSIVHELFVNTTNAIARTPFTTITSCFMKCSAHNKCSAIGFEVDLASEKNSDCLLFDKVDVFGNEEKEGLELMSVMTTNGNNIDAAEPVCSVDGGYGDWSIFSTCSTNCGDGTKTRKRQCNNPSPKGTGSNCSLLGQPLENRTCNVKPCVNIAKGKTATQSSNYSYEYTAKNGNDGRTETFMYTSNTEAPWWTVDLQKNIYIEYMILNAYATTSIYNLALVVETKKNVGIWKMCKNIGVVKQSYVDFKFTCNDTQTIARYVRVRSEKKCYLRFHELEMYAV